MSAKDSSKKRGAKSQPAEKVITGQFGTRHIDLLNPAIFKKYLKEFGMWDEREKAKRLWEKLFHIETHKMIWPSIVYICTYLKTFNEKERKKARTFFIKVGNQFLEQRRDQLENETRIFKELLHKPDIIQIIEKCMEVEKSKNGDSSEYYKQMNLPRRKRRGFMGAGVSLFLQEKARLAQAQALWLHVFRCIV